MIYWTIDDAEYMDLFLREGRPNGILSDRAGLLFQRFQTLRLTPTAVPTR